MSDPTLPPTVSVYSEFQRAFDHFNNRLFDGALPPVLMTMSRRKKRALGYFCKNSFEGRTSIATEGADVVTVPVEPTPKRDCLHEICMNPDYFQGRSDEDVLSTLVHEMAHHWQYCFGSPGKNAYHNKEWASKMESIGLHPISLDNDKGTGTRVTHDVVSDGHYQRAFRDLREFSLAWAARLAPSKTVKAAPKLVCKSCHQKVQGPKDTFIICGICQERMVLEGQDLEPNGVGTTENL